VPKNRQVSTTRVIPADRQQLFDLVADPRQHPVIDGSGTVVRTRPGLPERLHRGATFGMAMQHGTSYGITNRVVEFIEGEQIAWRHFHGHRWRYTFRDVDGGTEVTEAFDWTRARSKLVIVLAGYPRRNLRSMRETLARLEELALTGTVAARTSGEDVA